jgi:hypothetical protein
MNMKESLLTIAVVCLVSSAAGLAHAESQVKTNTNTIIVAPPKIQQQPTKPLQGQPQQMQTETQDQKNRKTLSNIMKKSSKTEETVIQNMK